MVAYNSLGSSPTLELHTRYANVGDLAIANLFYDSVSWYSIDLEPEIHQDNQGLSDHVSFWSYGYSAIMAIEDWTDHTPYYHTTGDQLETLNRSYYTEFTRAALATLAHMGGLLDGQIEGVVLDSVTGDPLPGATVEARSGSASIYSTTTSTNGSYQLPLPADTYTVTFSATDHRRDTVSNVQIIQGQINTLDHSLQPCIAVHDVDFSFSPDHPLVDETIAFTATIGGGEPPIDYSWDFWDGSNGSGQAVTHAYPKKCAYAVRLAVDNACSIPSIVLHPLLVEVELFYLSFLLR
jgi:hypothetical protein